MTAPVADLPRPLDARAEATWRWLQRFSRPPITVTATRTLTSVEVYIRADATAGAIVLTLPPAIDMVGLTVLVKKIDASANTVTVAAAGAELIDGAATVVLAVQYQATAPRSFGTGWDLT